MEDWNYFWSFLSFIIGFSSGFQAVYEHAKDAKDLDYRSTFFTFWGMGYCTSRGLVSAVTFIVLYKSGMIANNLWAWALGCGTGWETLLRSKFHIRQEKEDKEVLWGFFDLWKWYQDFLLTCASDSAAQKRRDFVKKYLPEDENFDEFCQRALTHIGTLRSEIQSEIRNTIKETRSRLETEIKEEKRKGKDKEKELNKNYRHDLA